MSSLYNIAERQQNLLEILRSGEVDEDQIETALAEVEQELVAKGADYIAVFQGLDAHIDAVSAEIKRLKDYKKSLEGNQKRMKNTVVEVMHRLGRESISTGRGAFKLKWNPESVEIDDIDKVPSQYLKTTITTSPDKNSIKAAIKAGDLVPGCHLEKVQRVEVK